MYNVRCTPHCRVILHDVYILINEQSGASTQRPVRNRLDVDVNSEHSMSTETEWERDPRIFKLDLFNKSQQVKVNAAWETFVRTNNSFDYRLCVFARIVFPLTSVFIHSPSRWRHYMRRMVISQRDYNFVNSIFAIWANVLVRSRSGNGLSFDGIPTIARVCSMFVME